MQGQRSLLIESPFSFIFAFFSLFLFQYIYILTGNKGILEFPFFSDIRQSSKVRISNITDTKKGGRYV